MAKIDRLVGADKQGGRMADHTETEPVEREDIELLISVARRLDRTSAMLLSGLETPLTFRQYRTLSRIMGGYSTLRELAARANLSIPSVSENIDGLAKRGLVETRPSQQDRRAITLHITPAGEAAHDAGERVLHEFIESLIAGFSPAQRAEFSKMLGAVYEAATDYLDGQLAD